MKEISKGDVDRLIKEFYGAKIQKAYGELGSLRLRELATALDSIHQALAYEKLTGGLTVIIALEQGVELLDPGNRVETRSVDLPAIVDHTATIQVLDGDRLQVVPESSNPLDFAKDAVVYHFDNYDYFAIDGSLERVINTTAYPSLFGTPTFFLLEDALEEYRSKQALCSQCPVLRDEVWSDGRRWWFRNKPEDKLQESLHRFVRTTVRGVGEVRREQIVGTRPTDLKVTWSLTNRIAYVEIKWLGASLNKDGTKPSTSYSESTAKEGATQLADYLDLNKDEASLHETLGYLVVFDGRRRGLKVDRASLSRSNGYFYRTKEIEYQPPLHEARSDFARPRRFFLEPAEVDD